MHVLRLSGFGPSRHRRRSRQPLPLESGLQRDRNETPTQLFHASEVQIISAIMFTQIVRRGIGRLVSSSGAGVGDVLPTEAWRSFFRSGNIAEVYQSVYSIEQFEARRMKQLLDLEFTLSKPLLMRVPNQRFQRLPVR